MSEILDLSTEEIEVISGAGDFESSLNVAETNEYPIVVNNPP